MRRSVGFKRSRRGRIGRSDIRQNYSGTGGIAPLSASRTSSGRPLENRPTRPIMPLAARRPRPLADVLDQSEVDALLAAVDTGQVQQEGAPQVFGSRGPAQSDVQLYDF